MAPSSSKPLLIDARIDTRVKLAALWASTTFCYVYGDYFEHAFAHATQRTHEAIQHGCELTRYIQLLGTSLMLAVPSMMVALSVLLNARVSRRLNLIVGMIFTLIMLAIAVQGGWIFYRVFALLEVALTCSIVWLAWRWPRVTASSDSVD